MTARRWLLVAVTCGLWLLPVLHRAQAESVKDSNLAGQAGSARAQREGSRAGVPAGSGPAPAGSARAQREGSRAGVPAGSGPAPAGATLPSAHAAPISEPIEPCQFYPSSRLKAAIRICDGTPWPAPTEMFVMPVMAACRNRFKGKSVLDIGTGSGILALYAAQLGAAKVVATDIEPRALACTRENARRLGLDSIVRTRLVTLKNPSAFSTSRPGEVFDIIVAFPPGAINRAVSLAGNVLDEGVTPEDNIKLGLSIIDGLEKHLSPDGAAILCYKFAVMHTLMVRYARYRGFIVEHHPAMRIPPSDWHALYNSYAARVANVDRVDPSALLMPPPRNVPFGRDYLKADWMGEKGAVFDRLWGVDVDRVLPGLMVIRKPPLRPPPEAALPVEEDDPQPPSDSLTNQCREYPAGLLKDSIRIANGLVWPALTERDMMPLMGANRSHIRGKTVLDIGTGSGILALYAAQLGAARVVATDIDPRALDCTQENARRLGLAPVIETRLVDRRNPSAFSTIRPGEVFDVIVGSPPHEANRVPCLVSGEVEDGATDNDFIRLGFSIVSGLRTHLREGGTALLIYRSTVLHDLLVRYAKHLGFAVAHHPTQLIVANDWCAVYNSFADRVARTEKLPPGVLLLPWAWESPADPDGPGAFSKLDFYGEYSGLFPRLWDDDRNRVVPGMIVIRKQATRSGKAMSRSSSPTSGLLPSR